MTLAAIPWLSISINLLLVVFVIVCFLMILLVLMQRPKQEGLGAAFGAGVTDQVFGARTTNVLQRGTVYMASLFFLLALVLAVLIGHKNQKISMLAAETASAAKAESEAAPDDAGQPKSLEESAPDAPPATEPADPPPVTPPLEPPSDSPPAETPAGSVDSALPAEGTSDQP